VRVVGSTEDEQRPVFDWDNLPFGVTEESLWPSLHDGYLMRVTSDRLERTARLEFNVPHLREFHKIQEETTFVFLFEGVNSVRILHNMHWPGKLHWPPGTPREEMIRLRAEYNAKARQESISWSSFETDLTDGKLEVEIADASLVCGTKGEIALKLGLLLDSRNYHELFVRSEGAEIQRGSGERLTLEEFLQFGISYWDAFTARGREQRAAETNVDET
jgi:hypothetical protein